MRNVATVCVSALQNNVRAVRARLKKGVKLCAVVKADAYGHGAPEVCRQIDSLVDFFAVALVEEGIALRLAGVKRPVLVLLPAAASELERALWYGLTLTAASYKGLKQIARAAQDAGVRAAVHLAVDTGMNRVGIRRKDCFLRCCRFAASSKHLILDGVFSHFSGGGEYWNNRQNALFGRRVALARAFVPRLTAHIAATSTLSCPTYQYDMVRAGLCLYGYGMDGVMPVMRLTAPVIARRTVRPDQRLLYADAPQKQTRVSIVRAGYADGLPRVAGCGLCVLPAMDTAAVEGQGFDCVELLGPTRRADEVADLAGTISYDVLARATVRANRIYR